MFANLLCHHFMIIYYLYVVSLCLCVRFESPHDHFVVVLYLYMVEVFFSPRGHFASLFPTRNVNCSSKPALEYIHGVYVFQIIQWGLKFIIYIYK